MIITTLNLRKGHAIAYLCRSPHNACCTELSTLSGNAIRYLRQMLTKCDLSYSSSLIIIGNTSHYCTRHEAQLLI
jgi:hypothetical protein